MPPNGLTTNPQQQHSSPKHHDDGYSNTPTSPEEEHQNSLVAVVDQNSPFYKSTDFKRFLRFGIVDSAILMLSLVAGVSFEGYIAKRIGVHGFGTIVGAGVGNCLSDTIAATSEGWKAGLGAFVGSSLPTLPIFGCLAFKKPLNTRTKVFIGASSVLLLIPGFSKWYP